MIEVLLQPGCAGKALLRRHLRRELSEEEEVCEYLGKEHAAAGEASTKPWAGVCSTTWRTEEMGATSRA